MSKRDANGVFIHWDNTAPVVRVGGGDESVSNWHRLRRWRAVLCSRMATVLALLATVPLLRTASLEANTTGREAWMSRKTFKSTLDCQHLALTGVDRLHPAQPEKLWRCDGCGYLAVPDGTGLLVKDSDGGYIFRRIEAHPEWDAAL